MSAKNHTKTIHYYTNIMEAKGSVNPKSKGKYPQNWILIEFSPPILRFLQAWGEIGPLNLGLCGTGYTANNK